MTPPEFIMVMTITGSTIGLVFFFAVPVRKAWLRKLEGAPQDQDPRVLEEVDQLRDRMGELEERLDFAERLLAQQRETAGLPPGGGR